MAFRDCKLLCFQLKGFNVMLVMYFDIGGLSVQLCNCRSIEVFTLFIWGQNLAVRISLLMAVLNDLQEILYPFVIYSLQWGGTAKQVIICHCYLDLLLICPMVRASDRIIAYWKGETGSCLFDLDGKGWHHGHRLNVWPLKGLLAERLDLTEEWRGEG